VFSPFLDLVMAPGAVPIWHQYVEFLEHALNFLAKTFNNAGIAVIVFTIMIKTALMPLTVKSIKSSKAMQELQPKIKELQKKYGKDRQQLYQETQALYRAHQVNPVSGCLPMLIQAPIFFGLYRAISNLSNGKGPADVSDVWTQSFLWLDNLATPDPYKILPILAGIFQFVQTKMMRPANQGKISDPQQAMMNTMMNFMPLMVVVFGWNFASGPVIYWVTQSVFSVVQQWFITGWGSLGDWIPGLPELPEHRRLGYRPPRDLDDVVVMSGAALPARTGIMGWFDKRMAEAQAQQTARTSTAKGGGTTGNSGSTDGAETRPSKGARPVKKSSPAAKAKRSTTQTGSAGSTPDDGAIAEPETISVNGSRPRAVPRKSRASRPPDEP